MWKWFIGAAILYGLKKIICDEPRRIDYTSYNRSSNSYFREPDPVVLCPSYQCQCNACQTKRTPPLYTKPTPSSVQVTQPPPAALKPTPIQYTPDLEYSAVTVKACLKHALDEIEKYERKEIRDLNKKLASCGDFYVIVKKAIYNTSDECVIHFGRALSLLEKVDKEFGIGMVLQIGNTQRIFVEELANGKITGSNKRGVGISSGNYPIAIVYNPRTKVEMILNRLDGRLYFPSPPIQCPGLTFKDDEYLNGNLNVIQKETIYKALRSPPSKQPAPVSPPSKQPAPVLIRGPPGTGKTTTLIELVYQIIKYENPNAVIIVATPSNKAADNVIERCPSAISHKVLRLISSVELLKSKDKPKVNGIAYGTEYSSFYSIVVCTIGKLEGFYSKEGVAITYPTHMIIDEASMVTDVDMVLVLGLLGQNTKFIMFGDDKQLGPVIKVDSLRDSFLQESMFERLFKDTSFEDNSPCLLENYRSHPGIVNLFNRLFYKRKLMAKVNRQDNKDIYNGLQKIHRVLTNIPTSPTGVYFKNVTGHCEMGESKSWKNEEEAKEIVAIYKSLINGNAAKVSDIGIITPYLDQVNLIRNMVDNQSVAIGSVDSFQGQERTVILVSTVRSTGSRGIGFVGNGKRLNVTLSRAKTALILVGNEQMLKSNRIFRDLFNMKGIHYI